MARFYLVKLFTLALIPLVLSACGGVSSSSGSSDNASLDSTPPVITLNGSAYIALIMGDTYTEELATATDNVDSVLTISITGSVDTSTLDTYTLTYSATDTAGNTGTATRTVVVSAIPDSTAPVITLNGSAYITLILGDTYSELNAAATDNVDGDLSGIVSITGSVDTNTLGTYTLIYSATDAAGNTGTVTRTVLVSAVPDTTAPIITLNGSATLYLFLEEVYTELNATAIDNVDGDLSSILSITGTVDVNTVGSYTLTYSATDTAGNTGTATRTVEVRLKRMLNDSGITWSGNYPSGNETDCTTGATFEQQDCYHGRDADGALSKVGGGMAGFDFTKLDASGNALTDQTQDYTTQPWSCVKDNHTGLVWEVKTADAQGTNLHSMNDIFNWYNTNPVTNGGGDGFADDDGNICTGYTNGNDSTRCNTQDFVARVNAVGLCGATDWRLPNLNELKLIVHLGKLSPVIDENYFPNNGLSFYWSSSPEASDVRYAWGVGFSDGRGRSRNRNNDRQVRLVRVGQ